MSEPTPPITTTRPRLALATCDDHPRLFADEQALVGLCEAAGLDARAVSWSDPAVDWRAFDLVVLRSTWNYFTELPAFRAWLDRLEASGVAVQNPLPLIRWNLDKRYLLELERGGVTIVPTRFVEAGERVDLAATLRARGWDEAILKPSVSGGAWRTHRFAADDARVLQAELDAITRSSGALIQPFVPEVASEGEWSLFFFAGAPSHAVVKTPKASDFRVQTQYGATFRPVEPEAALWATAQAIVARLPAAPLYARIDGVRHDGAFWLMEVEVIEPYLFMAQSPGAPERYVRAVAEAARAAAMARARY